MRGLRSLMWKEWRDLRALTVGAAVAAFWLSVWVQYDQFQFRDPQTTASGLVPCLVALFVAVVGSDLIARDVTTRRIETLALLPIEIADVWNAKVLVAASLTAAFTCWAVLCQLVIVGILGRDGAIPPHIVHLGKAVIPLSAVFVLAGVVTFFSTLLERGFATVIAAVAFIGGVYFLFTWIDLPFHGLVPTREGVAVMLLIVGAAFLYGSRRGFVRGPIHRGVTLRVACAAGLGVLFVLAPVGIAEAAWWKARVSLSPGGSEVRLAMVDVSPDGKHVVLTALDRKPFTDPRSASPPVGRSPGSTVNYTERVWWIDIESGALREVPERASTLLVGPGRWTPQGRLRIVTHTGSTVPLPEQLPVRVLDLETGETKAVAWDPLRGSRSAIRNASSRDDDGCQNFTVFLKERGTELTVRARRVRPMPESEVYEFLLPDGGKMLLDGATGRRWEGLDEGQELVTLCRAYSAVVVRERAETRVADLWTGETIAGPWSGSLTHPGVFDQIPDRYVALRDEARDVLLVFDLEQGGREVHAVSLEGREYHVLAGRGPGSFVLLSRGHDGPAAVDLIRKDGTLRRLYPPQETE